MACESRCIAFASSGQYVFTKFRVSRRCTKLACRQSASAAARARRRRVRESSPAARRVRSHHVIERHAAHFNLQIDAVEQRAGEFRKRISQRRRRRGIGLCACRDNRTDTIQRCDAHEARRICKCSGCARDRDDGLLKRLYHFDRGARKLGQLVEKEYAVMRGLFLRV